MVKISKTKVRGGIIEITRTIKTKVRIKCVVVITVMVLLRGTVWPH